jgi:hypothetical protein
VDAYSQTNQILGRYFFHLCNPEEVLKSWRHYEHHPSDGAQALILCESKWLPIDKAADKLDPYFTTKLYRLLESILGDGE